jgi:L-lactate dehydrogenase complex protein LldF
MTATFREFRQSAEAAIGDRRLQQALEGATGKFRNDRLAALADLPGVDSLRDHFKATRQATLARLADHLEAFERRATDCGTQVHWASDAQSACRIVLDIARQHNVRAAVKSKSMTSEEIHLNDALQAGGIEPVETDLGEWIVQLAGDPPSHIIAPAIHKTRSQVAELFSQVSGQSLSADDIAQLTAVARDHLRRRFLDAGLGISGANMIVAETGSIVLVSNEGNGRLVTSLPPVHVAVVGIEKVAATWDDAAVWLALLARSATGQPLSVYTSVITGPARTDDPDGPQEVHVVLVDNARSHQLGGAFEEVLQCIRCSACLNICPIYREAGGHAYGSPYSGPIGAVLNPRLFGLENYAALPHASSLCGACLDVCPVRIDLPRMLLKLREQEVEQAVIPGPERFLLRVAAWIMLHERLYGATTALLRMLQRPLSRQGHLRLPRRLNPGQDRSLPALAPRSFRQMWRSGVIGDP